MAVFTTTITGDSNGKKEIFTQRLHEVEQKNIEWFENRPAIFDYHEHDSIDNHTFSEVEGNSVRFNFWKHSELPEKIKSECLQAFKDVFGPANVLA
jgi:hypothetical protein